MNIPNGDMVGHTGDIEATVVACKAADEAVKVIINYVELESNVQNCNFFFPVKDMYFKGVWMVFVVADDC